MGQRKLRTEIPLVEVKGMDKNEKSEVWEEDMEKQDPLADAASGNYAGHAVLLYSHGGNRHGL